MIITRFTLPDPTHGDVPCIELRASDAPALPVCLFLYGGGGSCETLLELRPWLEEAWQHARLPACRVITPDVGPYSFYLDDAARGQAWLSFLRQRLLPHVAAADGVSVVGISMGGYGALKLAFEEPARVRAVAAVAPMLEPAFSADQVRPRSCFAYPPEAPAALLGPLRDPALYASDPPVQRARRRHEQIREHDLAIWIDAGSRDALHAHDGAELLHRVLWELDIPHEYHLLRDADHVGPTVLPRLEAAFRWTLEKLVPPVMPALNEVEQTWLEWLEAAKQELPGTPLPAASRLWPRVLRELLRLARDAAAKLDPSVERTYGWLPPL